MKQMSEKIPGGRVRKARKGSNMTIKELAAAVDMTPNHLGLVERGIKKTSDTLLKRVAEVTGVSLDWLRDGDGNDDSELEDVLVSDFSEDVDYYQIDARLFLTLLMAEDSDVTPANLAFILHTEEKTVDEVLHGEHPSAARKWATGFSALAQRLDIPTVSRKLRALAAYLDKEERIAMENQMKLLVQSLKNYAEKNGARNLRAIAQFNDESGEVPYYCMRFQSDGGMYWEFRYVQAVDAEFIDDFVKETLDNLPKQVNLFLVFDAKDTYEMFADKAVDYADEVDTLINEDPTGIPSSLPKTVSALLIDGETCIVQKEKDCWPEDERDYMI